MKYPGGRSLHTSNAKQPKSRDRLALRKCRVTRIPQKPQTTSPHHHRPIAIKKEIENVSSAQQSTFLFNFSSIS
jgi:hypothetical protein